jgi:uncharacterized membrane protein YgdD (TMEM256/DUF423 family)
VLTAISCPVAASCTTAGGNAIFSTVDGGSTWTEQSIPAITQSLLGLACPNTTTCQAVGTGSNLGGLILTLPAPPAITTTSLPLATIGVPYTATLAVTGGKSPMTWAISSGSLPAGLVFNPSTGVISGTPAILGSHVLSFTVTDANGLADAVTLTLTVNPAVGPGYWEVASDGGVFTYGGAQFFGSTGSLHLNAPIVGMAPTANDKGYWLVASDGGIFAFGNAVFYGSMGSMHLNAPIVAMATTPDGGGYWLVASDGGIFSFGDARFHGSTGNLVLDKPVVGMAPTVDGNGYWMVASDGGVFAFGDAAFSGSIGGLPLNQPIVGMASDPSGVGYWLVAADGGIYNFGEAGFFGSAGGRPLNAPIKGLATTADGLGYWMAATDGGIFSYGDARFYGSAGALPLNAPVVGIAAIQTSA